MKQTVYETKSVHSLILYFSVPAIFSLMVEMMAAVVDTAFAGHLGEDSVAALTTMGLLSPVLSIYTAVQALFAASTSIMIAKYLMDGLELLSRLKKEKEQIKVLILSANHQLETKLSGFELGASDYLTKPFHFEELEARIRSLLNRRFIQQTTRLVCHELCMDTLKRTVTVKEQELHLTAKEFAILEYFLLHEGCLITQQDLIDHVWDGDSDPFSNSIRVHLSALRKKIKGALGYDPIKPKIGEGYILS